MISYFATTGRGLEKFLADEIREKCHAEDMKCIDGKVFFSSAAGVDLKLLKSAERLMICIDFRPKVRFPYAKGKSRKLIRKITEEITTWEKGLKEWRKFQVTEEKEVLTESCAVTNTKTTETERGGTLQKDGEDTDLGSFENPKGDVWTCDWKSMDDSSSCNNVEGDNESHGSPKHGTMSCDNPGGDATSCQATSSGPPAVKKMKMDISDKDNVGDSITTAESKSQLCENTQDNEADSAASSSQESEAEKIKFRISCKCTGKLKNYHSPQEFAVNMGTSLAQTYGWRIELRKPQLEVSVHVSDEYFLIGLPVTAEPLSKRDYIKKIGIRSTIAWSMCNLANIKEGDVLLDPMCGTGTVLLEAAKSWMGIKCVGSDNHFGQLKLAKVNVQHAMMEGNIQLLHADVKNLPLKDKSIDCVVSDIPFGLNHSTVEDVRILYPAMQKELSRVTKPGGRAVLLTSGSMVDCLVEEMTGLKSRIVQVHNTQTEKGNPVATVASEEVSNWIKLDTHYLKIALIHAYICVFQRKD